MTVERKQQPTVDFFQHRLNNPQVLEEMGECEDESYSWIESKGVTALFQGGSFFSHCLQIKKEPLHNDIYVSDNVK